MFFNRNKAQDDLTLSDAEMTPGIKEKIDDMVTSWSEVTLGLRDANPDPNAQPLQVIRKADVDYLMKAMESEASRIEDEMDREIADRRRLHQSEIAQKDAQIAALNRDIERTKAKVLAQDAEIERRAEARVSLLATVARIDGTFDASGLLKNEDIRREVVRRKFGDAAIDGKSEAYIDERFESLEARVNVDPFARVMQDHQPVLDAAGASDRAYQQYCEDLRNAHKTRH